LTKLKKKHIISTSSVNYLNSKNLKLSFRFRIKSIVEIQSTFCDRINDRRFEARSLFSPLCKHSRPRQRKPMAVT